MSMMDEDDEMAQLKAEIAALQSSIVNSVVCNRCKLDTDDHLLVLCETCDVGALHTYCCVPKLPGVPRKEWYCPTCYADPNINTPMPLDSLGQPMKPPKMYPVGYKKKVKRIQGPEAEAHYAEEAAIKAQIKKLEEQIIELEIVLGSDNEDYIIPTADDPYARESGKRKRSRKRTRSRSMEHGERKKIPRTANMTAEEMSEHQLRMEIRRLEKDVFGKAETKATPRAPKMSEEEKELRREIRKIEAELRRDHGVTAQDVASGGDVLLSKEERLIREEMEALSKEILGEDGTMNDADKDNMTVEELALREEIAQMQAELASSSLNASHLDPMQDSGSSSESEDDEEHDCTICGDSDTTPTNIMITCDICKKWYHLKCVDLSLGEYHCIAHFTCLSCCKTRYGEFARTHKILYKSNERMELEIMKMRDMESLNRESGLMSRAMNKMSRSGKLVHVTPAAIDKALEEVEIHDLGLAADVRQAMKELGLDLAGVCSNIQWLNHLHASVRTKELLKWLEGGLVEKRTSLQVQLRQWLLRALDTMLE